MECPMRLSKEPDFLICIESLAIHRHGAKSGGRGEHGIVLKLYAIICRFTKKYIVERKKRK